MSVPGSNTSARFFRLLVTLVTLFAALLLILLYRKKVTSQSKAKELLNMLTDWDIGEQIKYYIVSQAAHETNGFTSKIFKSNNNAFGMKYAGQSLSIGEKNGYADYATVLDSVKDFVKWYLKRVPVLLTMIGYGDIAKFVSFLKKNDYFEDTEENYCTGVTSWYNKLFV